MIQMISIADLHPHKDNPRKDPRGYFATGAAGRRKWQSMTHTGSPVSSLMSTTEGAKNE